MGSLFFLIGGKHASPEVCEYMGPLEQFFKVAGRAWLFLVFLDIVVVVRNPYMPGRHDGKYHVFSWGLAGLCVGITGASVTRTISSSGMCHLLPQELSERNYEEYIAL